MNKKLDSISMKLMPTNSYMLPLWIKKNKSKCIKKFLC